VLPGGIDRLKIPPRTKFLPAISKFAPLLKLTPPGMALSLYFSFGGDRKGSAGGRGQVMNPSWAGAKTAQAPTQWALATARGGKFPLLVTGGTALVGGQTVQRREMGGADPGSGVNTGQHLQTGGAPERAVRG